MSYTHIDTHAHTHRHTQERGDVAGTCSPLKAAVGELSPSSAHGPLMESEGSALLKLGSTDAHYWLRHLTPSYNNQIVVCDCNLILNPH